MAGGGFSNGIRDQQREAVTMPWRPITAANIIGRMTVSEQAMLTNAAGATDKLQERLTDAIAEFDSAMIGMGFPVAASPNMVDRFRNAVMSKAVWEWLKDFPQLKQFKTDERKDAAKDAQLQLDKIANRQAGSIEAPAGFATTGNWDSAPRVLMRLYPGVPPQVQWNNDGQQYGWPLEANPNATSLPPLLTAPDAPKNCWVNASQGLQLQINFVQPNNAFSYLLYRGTTASNVTLYMALGNVNNYIDTAVSQGQTLYYSVVALNAIGQSPQSNTAFGTVTA